MDVKHLHDINMGFKFDNFPSFQHILCMYKTESDISSKITNIVQQYFVTVLFDNKFTMIQFVHYVHRKFVQNEK